MKELVREVTETTRVSNDGRDRRRSGVDRRQVEI
jgi:hypothetical protein